MPPAMPVMRTVSPGRTAIGSHWVRRTPPTVTSAGAPVTAMSTSADGVQLKSSAVISTTGAPSSLPVRTLATRAEYWSSAPLTGSPWRARPKRPRSCTVEWPAWLIVRVSATAGPQRAAVVVGPLLRRDRHEPEAVAGPVRGERIGVEVEDAQGSPPQQRPATGRPQRAEHRLPPGHRDRPGRHARTGRGKPGDRLAERGAVHHGGADR